MTLPPLSLAREKDSGCIGCAREGESATEINEISIGRVRAHTRRSARVRRERQSLTKGTEAPKEPFARMYMCVCVCAQKKGGNR